MEKFSSSLPKTILLLTDKTLLCYPYLYIGDGSMIFEFTKNLANLGGDFVLRDESLISFCNIDFIKGGLVLTNDKGNLIAQILQSKNNVTVTIADGPSVTVNENYQISPMKIEAEEKSFITDKDKSRMETSEFFYFGTPSKFMYEIYVKEMNGIKPYLGAEVINHPWKEDYFKVRISDGVNKLKMLSLVLAFTLITLTKK